MNSKSMNRRLAIQDPVGTAEKLYQAEQKLEKAKNDFQSIINISQEEKIRNFAEQALKDLCTL